MKKNESTELLIQIPLSPERAIAIFEAPENIGELIDTITTEARARAGTVDATTEQGRAKLVSLAYTVARTKTTIDDLGKSQVEGIKKAAKVIDDSRKIARDRLDALRDEIRKPVTEFENREKARVENHRRSLAGLEALGVIHVGTPLEELNRRAESLAAFDTAAMEEFAERAKELKEIGIARVRAAIEAMEAAMVQEQEAKRLREENAALLAEKARLEAAAAAATATPPAPVGPETPPEPATAPVVTTFRTLAELIEATTGDGGDSKLADPAPVFANDEQTDIKREYNRAAFRAVNAIVLNENISRAIMTAIIRGEIPHVSIRYDR